MTNPVDLCENILEMETASADISNVSTKNINSSLVSADELENSSLPSSSLSHSYKNTIRVKPTTSCNKIRSENISKAVAKLIVQNMLSYSFVESIGFKNFMAVVKPGYNIPCKKTIKNRIDFHYSVVKEKIKKELEDIPYIVAVSDCWSSRSQDSYLTVSVNYLTNNWKYKTVCLAAQEADERHSAENLCIRTTEIIEEFNLKDKVAVVVTDNAANAINSVELMEGVEETIDVQCAAHTLQLAVNEGLRLYLIKNVCSKASRVVGHFKHSNVATYALEEKQKQLGLKKLKLIQNCPTRWNSTYAMIERLISNKLAIQAVLGDRKITKPAMVAKLDLSALEWKLLDSIAETLKPLELATTVLCAEDSCISMVRPLISSLINNHLQAIDGEEDINEYRLKIMNSLQLRFHMTHGTNVTPWQIASFLNPRYKSLDAEESEAKKLIHETVLEKLICTSTPLTEALESKQTALDILFKKSASIDNNSANHQFEKYIVEPIVSYNDSPYEWWEKHAIKFPSFIPLVRKYLSIPATLQHQKEYFRQLETLLM